MRAEREDFQGTIANPQAAIAARKALTAAALPKFRETSAVLDQMDGLILRFRKTEAGSAFVENYQTARVVRDLGS